MNISQIPLLTLKMAPRVGSHERRGKKKRSPEERMIYSSPCHPYLLLQGNSLPVLLIQPKSVAFQSTCWASKLTHLGAPLLSGQQTKRGVGLRPVQLKPCKVLFSVLTFPPRVRKDLFPQDQGRFELEGPKGTSSPTPYFTDEETESQTSEGLKVTHGVMKQSWMMIWNHTFSFRVFICLGFVLLGHMVVSRYFSIIFCNMMLVALLF